MSNLICFILFEYKHELSKTKDIIQQVFDTKLYDLLEFKLVGTKLDRFLKQ